MRFTKLGLIIVLCGIIFLLTGTLVFAEDDVVETPYIRVVVDGKVTEFSDVPVSVNQRMMLPAREFLVNLDVKDDDKHIVWNEKEKSITVSKNSTKIYLKIESKTAHINDTPVALDTAPIIYANKRVYIPVRFVSQALGKKVVWDGSTKSVYIRDEDEFNRVKEILEKSSAAMEKVSSCKLDADFNLGISQNKFKIKMGAGLRAEIDSKEKKMYTLINIDMFGMEMLMDLYYLDNFAYYSNPMTNEWYKEVMTEEEFETSFEDSSNWAFITAEDVLCAGLVLSKNKDTDETILKGNVYLDELYDSALNASGNVWGAFGDSGVKDEASCFIEISLDQNTYLVNSVTMQITSNMGVEDEDSQMVMDIGLRYSSYNEDFDIVLPEGVKENALEIDRTGQIQKFKQGVIPPAI